jgi:hypothetical protein
MSATDKFSVKEIIVGVVVLAVIGAAMYYTLGVLAGEGGKKVTDISQAGDAAANHVETHVKLVAIDPIKADLTARFEFEPSEGLLGEDLSLKQDLKLYVNAANGKQEFDFPKGKLMTPVEAVFNMHDGLVTDYPFDKYASDIDIYIYAPEPKPGDKKKADAPEPKPAADQKDDAAENDMAISVDFTGSIPGYKISASKAKSSDIDYVGVETRIERSGIVTFFSVFVSLLMWALAIGVLFFVGALVLRGRKIEVNMFSFMGALLFAFYAVRNSQPNVPPIGAYCDFVSFFWAEALIAACLVVALATWILRPMK